MKQKRKRNRDGCAIAKEYANKALAPLLKAVSKRPSDYARIAEAMTAKGKETIFRQEVNAWLHPDPAKRIEPRLGMGLLLLEQGAKAVAQANAREAKEKAAKRAAKGGGA